VLMPVHAREFVAMGLWLLDNCDLEACATTAGEFGQWDFQLRRRAGPLAGTSGSPVNRSPHSDRGHRPSFADGAPASAG